MTQQNLTRRSPAVSRHRQESHETLTQRLKSSQKRKLIETGTLIQSESSADGLKVNSSFFNDIISKTHNFRGSNIRLKSFRTSEGRHRAENFTTTLKLRRDEKQKLLAILWSFDNRFSAELQHVCPLPGCSHTSSLSSPVHTREHFVKNHLGKRFRCIRCRCRFKSMKAIYAHLRGQKHNWSKERVNQQLKEQVKSGAIDCVYFVAAH